MNSTFPLITSLLILCTHFQAFAFQNIDKLLSDLDITWAGEVYVDYFPNTRILSPENPKIKKQYGNIEYNDFRLLKMQNEVNEDWLKEIPNQLSHRLLQLNNNNLNVYKEADLVQKLSFKAYQDLLEQEWVDTITTYDPETFEDIIMVIINRIEISAVKKFRVKQVFSYNEKLNILTIVPLSIAPIVTIKSKGSKEIREYPLFWLPITEPFSPFNLSDSSVTWAKRLTKDIPCNSIKTIKGKENLTSIFYKMVTYYKANSSSAEVYQGNGKKLTALTPTEIEMMGAGLDTLIIFDPENPFGDISPIVEYNLAPDFAVKIRIIQDWIWNKNTQEMQVKVLGFAPIKLEDELYHLPFYYIKS